MQIINSWRATHRYAFLSNFHLLTESGEGMKVPLDVAYFKDRRGKKTPTAISAEHAYQALKSTEWAGMMSILGSATPGTAKRRGNRIKVRDDWEEVKIGVMRAVLRAKFTDKSLRAQLVATAPDLLVEGNFWGDRYWGVYNGEGLNWLGLLLMEVRNECMT